MPVMIGIWSNGIDIRAGIINKNLGKAPFLTLDKGQIEIYFEGEIPIVIIEPVARYVIANNIQHEFT